VAEVVEQRLHSADRDSVTSRELRDIAAAVLADQVGERYADNYRRWQRAKDRTVPLVVLIGGTTGVGKSTLATMLAHRLGITRVIATDVIRQVLRAFFSHEFMPSVHPSAFEVVGEDGLAGYEDQAAQVSTGIAAIVERAVGEGTPLVIEGVHILPGVLEEELRGRCVLVEALLAVEDEDSHRGHFALRGARRPAERYLAGFAEIRRLQEHLSARAQAEGVPVLNNESADATLPVLMELVLDAVGNSQRAEE